MSITPSLASIRLCRLPPSYTRCPRLTASRLRRYEATNQSKPVSRDAAQTDSSANKAAIQTEGLVRDNLEVAYPEIPLAYYRTQPDAMHSIQHRMFYINWFAALIGLEVLREILD